MKLEIANSHYTNTLFRPHFEAYINQTIKDYIKLSNKQQRTSIKLARLNIFKTNDAIPKNLLIKPIDNVDDPEVIRKICKRRLNTIIANATIMIRELESEKNSLLMPPNTNQAVKDIQIKIGSPPPDFQQEANEMVNKWQAAFDVEINSIDHQQKIKTDKLMEKMITNHPLNIKDTAITDVQDLQKEDISEMINEAISKALSSKLNRGKQTTNNSGRRNEKGRLHPDTSSSNKPSKQSKTSKASKASNASNSSNSSNSSNASSSSKSYKTPRTSKSSNSSKSFNSSSHPRSHNQTNRYTPTNRTFNQLRPFAATAPNLMNYNTFPFNQQPQMIPSMFNPMTFNGNYMPYYQPNMNPLINPYSLPNYLTNSNVNRRLNQKKRTNMGNGNAKGQRNQRR